MWCWRRRENRPPSGGVQPLSGDFVIDPPHGDEICLRAFPAETTEAFWRGSSRRFAVATPPSMSYRLTDALHQGVKSSWFSRLADQCRFGHDLGEDVRAFGDNDYRAAVGQVPGEVVDRLLRIGEGRSPKLRPVFRGDARHAE